MVPQFNDGMQARVQNDGEHSELFPVTNEVKQCFVMAPTLFSMMQNRQQIEHVNSDCGD